MRIFKTKWFGRFAKKEKIDDTALIEAIERAECGLIDADLGSFLIKQRIAKEGQGRSKGYRTLIAHKYKNRAVFLYGFAKNERDNIDDNELMSLKDIAISSLNMSEQDMKRALEEGRLQEVKYDKKN